MDEDTVPLFVAAVLSIFVYVISAASVALEEEEYVAHIAKVAHVFGEALVWHRWSKRRPNSNDESKVFGGESKVPKSNLNAILLELFKVLGHKSTVSIDFEYKNGSKGRAVIIPCVKDEDSFQRQAQRT